MSIEIHSEKTQVHIKNAKEYDINVYHHAGLIVTVSLESDGNYPHSKVLITLDHTSAKSLAEGITSKLEKFISENNKK